MTPKPVAGLSRLEELILEAEELGIIVDFSILRKADNLDGLYLEWPHGSVILINPKRSIEAQTVALAEEIGHFHKSAGIIISQSDVRNRKSEIAGRGWSYSRLLPPDDLSYAVESGMCAPWELAETFDVDELFISEALKYFESKGIIPTVCGWCSVG